jgi:hypothetical protein
MVFIVVFIFAFILIEMTSSIITNFCFFARQINLLPNVDDGVKRLNFIGTTFKILLREIGFEISVKVVKRRMILTNFSQNNGGSFNRLPDDVDKAIWLLFSEILVMVLLPMLVYYFYG